MVVCHLCKSSKEDDIQYGDMLQNERMAVHTFCLYLSSNLLQNGEDDEGFLGFLEADVIKESRRVSHLHCCYCHKRYANVGCCNIKCRHTFHFICGLENGAKNQFFGSYQSHCHLHVSKPKLPLPPKNATCVICFDNLLDVGKRFNRLTTIQAPCCRNGWFHKLCLQRSAKMAGYFFKCPLCNDVQVFRQKLSMEGIFIPNQDAAWELEPNAFAELLERPNECIATDCSCKQGRTSCSIQNPLIYCSMCGSKAMHKNCMPNPTMRFHCADCTITIEHNRSRMSFNELGDYNKDNDDEIDVCNVSDKEDLEILRGLLPSTTIAKEAKENNVKMSVDEEVRVPIRRRTRLLSCDSPDSENKCENPRPSRRTTISSSSDDVIKVSKSNRRLRANRVVADAISSEDDYTQLSTSREETQQHHPNRNVGDGAKYSMISDTEESCEDEEVSGSIVSISSDEVCLSRRSVKRKLLGADEDDSESSTPEKQIKLHSKCDINKTILNLGEKCYKNSEEDTKLESKSDDGQDSAVVVLSSSEDSDDDPLENFTKMLQKQMDRSCIAQRTRNKSGDKMPHKLQTNTAINNGLCLSKIQDCPKSIKYQERLDRGKDNNLDISCIARRTRRRTMYCKGTEKLLQKNESNSLTMRRRRLSICGQTPKEESKQRSRLPDTNDTGIITTQSTKGTIPYHKLSCEMSPIYEKEFDTDEDDPETRQHANTNIFEISCIANRTRKRQSIKLQNSIEEDESTDLRSNSATRLPQRILSISSEDTENGHNDVLAIRAHHSNEKWPKQNYEISYHRKDLQIRNSSAYHLSKLKQCSY